jgi:hypothetical protein
MACFTNDGTNETPKIPNSKHQITNKRQGPMHQTTNACGGTELLAAVWPFGVSDLLFV